MLLCLALRKVMWSDRREVSKLLAGQTGLCLETSWPLHGCLEMIACFAMGPVLPKPLFPQN